MELPAAPDRPLHLPGRRRARPVHGLGHHRGRRGAHRPPLPRLRHRRGLRQGGRERGWPPRSSALPADAGAASARQGGGRGRASCSLGAGFTLADAKVTKRRRFAGGLSVDWIATDADGRGVARARRRRQHRRPHRAAAVRRPVPHARRGVGAHHRRPPRAGAHHRPPAARLGRRWPRCAPPAASRSSTRSSSARPASPARLAVYAAGGVDEPGRRPPPRRLSRAGALRQDRDHRDRHRAGDHRRARRSRRRCAERGGRQRRRRGVGPARSSCTAPAGTARSSRRPGPTARRSSPPTRGCAAGPRGSSSGRAPPRRPATRWCRPTCASTTCGWSAASTYRRCSPTPRRPGCSTAAWPAAPRRTAGDWYARGGARRVPGAVRAWSAPSSARGRRSRRTPPTSRPAHRAELRAYLDAGWSAEAQAAYARAGRRGEPGVGRPLEGGARPSGPRPRRCCGGCCGSAARRTSCSAPQRDRSLRLRVMTAVGLAPGLRAEAHRRVGRRRRPAPGALAGPGPRPGRGRGRAPSTATSRCAGATAASASPRRPRCTSTPPTTGCRGTSPSPDPGHDRTLAAWREGGTRIGSVTSSPTRARPPTAGDWDAGPRPRRRRAGPRPGRRRGAGTCSSGPTTPTPTAGERRQLTVMFCDVVGSTALSQEHDPELVREVLRSYQVTCDRVVRRYEGRIARYIGDGVLAYFGHPVAHEDDARRGVKAGPRPARGAAAGHRRGARALRRRPADPRGRAHRAWSCGPTWARRPPRTATPSSARPRTSPPASRTTPSPGTLLISHDTYELVRGWFLVAPLGPVDAQGHRRAGAGLPGGRGGHRGRRGCTRRPTSARSSGGTRSCRSCSRPGTQVRAGGVRAVVAVAGSRASASRAWPTCSAGGWRPTTAPPASCRCSTLPRLHRAAPGAPAARAGRRHRAAPGPRARAAEAVERDGGGRPGRRAAAVADLLELPPTAWCPAPELEGPKLRERAARDAARRGCGPSPAAGPLLLVVDDLQWADPTHPGAARPGDRARRCPGVLLVATVRDDAKVPWSSATTSRSTASRSTSWPTWPAGSPEGRRAGRRPPRAAHRAQRRHPALPRGAAPQRAAGQRRRRARRTRTSRRAPRPPARPLRGPGVDLRLAQVLATIGPEAPLPAGGRGDAASTPDAARRSSSAALVDAGSSRCVPGEPLGYRFRHHLLAELAYDTQLQARPPAGARRRWPTRCWPAPSTSRPAAPDRAGPPPRAGRPPGGGGPRSSSRRPRRRTAWAPTPR